MSWSVLGRHILVFAAVFGILAAIAGKSAVRPSTDNHYVHMAQGWLEGRSTLQGKPPHGNDWGRITTLRLRDGRVVDGFPCRTAACKRQAAREGTERWFQVGGGSIDVPRRDIVARQDRWMVTFPPGPALVVAPFVAIWGLHVWDVLLTIIAAALGANVLLWFLDREHETARRHEHLWCVAAWSLASPMCFVAANGSVWFTAQVLGALFFLLYVSCAWNSRRPILAGLWLGMAVACRPPLLLGLPIVVWEWWRGPRRPSTLLQVGLPLLFVGAVLAWFNWIRFDDPLEFGHRFLDIRWQARIQDHGLFAFDYLPRNLHAMLLLLPTIDAGHLRWSIHGMSVLVSTPWLAALVGARRPYPQRAVLWATVPLLALPGLLYQNTGQVQFTYRFALDWLPLALIGLFLGGGSRTWWFRSLVVAGSALGIYGAWMFAHAPGRLFLRSLWPYG